MQKDRFEVRKVIKRGTHEFLGYLKKDLGRFLIEAENSRLFVPFKILGDVRKGEPGDKVVAQFVRWDPPAKIPTCKVVRILGPWRSQDRPSWNFGQVWIISEIFLKSGG